MKVLYDDFRHPQSLHGELCKFNDINAYEYLRGTLIILMSLTGILFVRNRDLPNGTTTMPSDCSLVCRYPFSACAAESLHRSGGLVSEECVGSVVRGILGLSQGESVQRFVLGL